MEIELPDGTILDAPDGADIKKVVKNYRRQQIIASNPEEYAPGSEKYSPVQEAFTEGTGSGMVRATRGLGSMMNKGLNAHPLAKAIGGISLPNSDFYSDEAIREQEQIDRPLAKTTAGSLGQLGGETAVLAAATAPIGGIGGAAPGANMLARTLRSAPVRAGVEGAVGGGALASPDEQGEGMAKGAGLSMLMDRMFAGGGRAVRGLVKKSQAAQELEHLAGQHGEDLFIPLSQAADENDATSRLVKQIYSEALPIIPGVKYKLNRQGNQASEKVREMAVKEAAPSGSALPARPGHNMEESVGVIQKNIDDTYKNTMKSYTFNIPQDFNKRLAKRIRKSAVGNTTVDDTTLNTTVGKVNELMARFSNGKNVIDGTNLLNVRSELTARLKRAKDFEKGPLKASIDEIDQVMADAQSYVADPKTFAKDFGEYKDLENTERLFRPVKEAADATPETEGRFLFKTLARKAENVPEQRAIGQLGSQTLDKPAAVGTLTGRILANVGLAGAGVGAFMAPTTTAAAMVGGQVLTTKVAQKALMGDTSAQRAVAAYLQKNPDQAENVERILRQAAVSGASGE